MRPARRHETEEEVEANTGDDGPPPQDGKEEEENGGGKEEEYHEEEEWTSPPDSTSTTPSTSPPQQGEKNTSTSTTAVISSSETNYLCNSRNPRILLCICVGLNVGDWTAEPYVSASGKKQLFKPTRADLVKMVLRRAEILDIRCKPRPSGWDISTCIEFLKKHPITNAPDIIFVKAREQALRAPLSRMQEEAADTVTSNHIDGFHTYRSLLQIYHCLLHQGVRISGLHFERW